MHICNLYVEQCSIPRAVKCTVGHKVYVHDCNRGSNGKKRRFLESMRELVQHNHWFWKETGFLFLLSKGTLDWPTWKTETKGYWLDGFGVTSLKMMLFGDTLLMWNMSLLSIPRIELSIIIRAHGHMLLRYPTWFLMALHIWLVMVRIHLSGMVFGLDPHLSRPISIDYIPYQGIKRHPTLLELDLSGMGSWFEATP